MKTRTALKLAVFLGTTLAIPQAQLRVAPLDLDQGHVALGLALRHLGNTGTFMMATAHPDDENNGLLVMLNRGQGYRTALVTATRGNGGQNEIGPELSEALGVLRTEELHAIHRFDGAEQYFTRAVDFGFSFSIDETFEKWGREEILGDYVRLIRTIRPDVMTGLTPTGNGGGQHHQASSVLAHEAFKAAADPSKYPEQIAAGLRPWQPKKFYFTTQFGLQRSTPVAPGEIAINLTGYDPLLGRTYAEIGSEARSMHKCQGTDQLLALPGPAAASYTLVESKVGPLGGAERALFDGIDSSINGLARFADPHAPIALTESLGVIANAVQMAQTRFASEGDDATVASLSSGLRATRSLRATLPTIPITAASRAEIDDRLAQKEREFEGALLLANRVRVDALADDHVVVPGQPVRLSLRVANRGDRDITVKHVAFMGLEGDAACTMTAVTGGRPGDTVREPPLSSIGPSAVGQCAPVLIVPTLARVTEPYWHRAGEAGRYAFDADAPFGLPYRPTPFRARLTLSIAGGDDVVADLPIQARYQNDVFGGEKRGDLLVVPALSVSVSPSVALIPALRTGGVGVQPDASREIRVLIANDGKGASAHTVRLNVPAGWGVTPDQQSIAFAREDESQTVRFRISPPTGVAFGDVSVKAIVGDPGETFSRGFQTVEYPHIRRQHVYREAETRVKVMDVRTAPNLSVGYVMGVGDDVPAAIEQLGVKIEMIGADDLAWGDLSRFSTIVTGVRAYERRADLRANNGRLLDYVRNGGTMIVQYNKFEFNDAQYGPFPAKVSAVRATDETAPVRPLAADTALLNTPNPIVDSVWSRWVQERGLYFLGEKDSRYRDLLVIDERIPNNAGDKLGALVYAPYGKGHWVYVGLNLWRQLPAGVGGAYPLLANLVSLGH